MLVQSLSCNKCGAPLSVTQNTNYVTCGHCGSRLVIRRDANAVYTEVLTEMNAHLGQISQHTAQTADHTAQMTGDLTAMRLQNDLDRLEREWQQEKSRRLKAYSATAREMPTMDLLRNQTIGSLIVGALMLPVVLSTQGGLELLSGLTLLICIILLIRAAYAYPHVKSYDVVEANFIQKRDDIRRRMHENDQV